MLYIDNKNYKITNQKIFVGNYIKNGESGYDINIQLLFIDSNSKEQGYINLSVGFEKDNDINNFLNREYKGVPFEADIFFEVFDTKKFLDTEIASKILVKLKEIIDDKVKVIFELNDDLIKIKFDGLLSFTNSCK